MTSTDLAFLYKVLDDSGSIKDLDTRVEEDEPLSVEQGNVIKISGNCTTDPFYRLLSAGFTHAPNF